MFENIECEWPLFLELLLLDALIRGDCSAVTEYRKQLEDVVLRDGEDGIVTVPELYLVPEDKVGQTSFPHSPILHSPIPHSPIPCECRCGRSTRSPTARTVFRAGSGSTCGLSRCTFCAGCCRRDC